MWLCLIQDHIRTLCVWNAALNSQYLLSGQLTDCLFPARHKPPFISMIAASVLDIHRHLT